MLTFVRGLILAYLVYVLEALYTGYKPSSVTDAKTRHN